MATILLGCGRPVSAARYIAGIKTAKANPTVTYARGLRSWWPVTGAEIVREYRDDLQRRITRRAGEAPRWRKLDPDWQRHCLQLAGNLNSRVVARARDVRITMGAAVVARLGDRLEAED